MCVDLPRLIAFSLRWTRNLADAAPNLAQPLQNQWLAVFSERCQLFPVQVKRISRFILWMLMSLYKFPLLSRE